MPVVPGGTSPICDDDPLSPGDEGVATVGVTVPVVVPALDSIKGLSLFSCTHSTCFDTVRPPSYSSGHLKGARSDLCVVMCVVGQLNGLD